MNRYKVSLLATAVMSVVASQASAQVALNAPMTTDGALHGAGASSIQNILVRNLNCIGTGTTGGVANPDKKLGKSNNTFSTIAPGNFVNPTTPSLSFNCATQHIQPNVSGDYVSTGSGFGRTMWSQFNDDFDGATAATTGAQTIAAGVFNPFGTTGRWTNLQFAFSDAGLGQGDLTVYNANAAAQAGAAITFPMFVLPVAIAFPTTYGTTANGAAMVFNTKGRGLNGTTTLNLTKAVYCGIFNGDILNWNNPAIKALNGTTKTSLQDLVSDTATRWAADGAPIRLVGRLDKSGTTDVFTRHLAAACTTANGYTGTNKYTNHAESLPYNAASNGNADFTVVRSDSNYKPSVSPSKLAGTTNLISGDYWNGSAIVNLGGSTPTSLPAGNVGSGLYLIADGGGKVASALVSAPDYVLGGVKLNGKVGYISADFVQPSVDAPGGLQAAALQVANTASYALPTVSAALKGITQLPPESTATGTYQAGDARLVNPVTGSTKVAATRANPLAWTDVLYADAANNLADPQAALSYPISGTTQFFGYTCYKTDNRLAIVNSLGLQLGKIKKDSANVALGTGIFGGTSPTAGIGIDVQSNIGIMPVAWQTAITNTFLSKPSAVVDAGAAGLNLYIQDLLIAKLGTVSVPEGVSPYPNATCQAPGTARVPAKGTSPAVPFIPGAVIIPGA